MPGLSTCSHGILLTNAPCPKERQSDTKSPHVGLAQLGGLQIGTALDHVPIKAAIILKSFTCKFHSFTGRVLKLQLSELGYTR